MVLTVKHGTQEEFPLSKEVKKKNWIHHFLETIFSSSFPRFSPWKWRSVKESGKNKEKSSVDYQHHHHHQLHHHDDERITMWCHRLPFRNKSNLTIWYSVDDISQWFESKQNEHVTRNVLMILKHFSLSLLFFALLFYSDLFSLTSSS